MCSATFNSGEMTRKGQAMETLDRRARYTRSAIHDAFFALLEQKGFSKMTVADICREADISRGTFYLHYEDKYALLDAMIDEALDADPPISESGAASLCQRAPSTERYRLIYRDDEAFSRVTRRVLQRAAPEAVPALMEATGLSEDLARLLFTFTVHGNLAVNREHGWVRDARYMAIQQVLNAYTAGGAQAVREMQGTPAEGSRFAGQPRPAPPREPSAGTRQN